MPKVSVIIPTYNRPQALKEALRSVFMQTYEDFEVIVVDDGTKERSDSVVKEMNDSRVQYISHSESRGGGAARNTGIKSASGTFIALLDDDDAWYPEKLEIQMREFEPTSPEVGYSFTAVENIYDDRKEITRVPDGIGNYLELLTRHFSGFLNVTLIIKKAVLQDVGYFDESFPSHQETDLLMRIAKKYKGLGINRPLTHVNMHDGHSSKNLRKIIEGRVMILKKYFDDFSINKTTLAYHFFKLGLLYRDNRQYALASTNFKKAWLTKTSLDIYCITYPWHLEAQYINYLSKR